VKRVVLLAPGATPPLTEGRKKFVVDLAQALQAKGIQVRVLDGSPASSIAIMVWRSLHQLRVLLRSSEPIDGVAVFPFGTFGGLRGRVNTWFLRQARNLCVQAGVAQIPVFYSCAGLSLASVGASFGPALAVGCAAQGVAPIHLGIRHPDRVWRPTESGLTRLLFLCGYQHPTQRALGDVLNERGLADLLDSGDELAQANIRLTVAIPFLRDMRIRQNLLAQSARRCPKLKIDMLDEVDPGALFMSHDAFVFPYRSEHAVFTPTSMLEAMSIGIPLIAADHAMYRGLTNAEDGPRCALHKVGDARDLARVAIEMQRGYDLAVRTAQAASIQVRAQWRLEIAADDLLRALTLRAR
jgi:Glycosyl transferases group 1